MKRARPRGREYWVAKEDTAMFRKLIVGFGAAALALIVLAAAAWAGGWSVVTLDSTPTNLQPGTPFDIGFTVRQHGQTPLAGLKPVVRFSRTDSTVTVNETARDEGAPGHYAARITLPSAGK